MGRVARYKKIKDIDPYSKKNGGRVELSTVGVWGFGDDGRKVKKRSKTAERLRNSKMKRKRKNNDKKGGGGNYDDGTNDESVFDLPPREADEFDIKDLLGSVKKQKIAKNVLDDDDELLSSAAGTGTGPVDMYHQVPVGKNIAMIPKSDNEEKKVAKILKYDDQTKIQQQNIANKKTDGDKKKQQQQHMRMEGESKRAYNRRTNIETRILMKQSIRQSKSNTEKIQRKKEFLNNKKKNKGKKRKGYNNDVVESAAAAGAQEDVGTGRGAHRHTSSSSSYSDEPRFGEQVERPPVFRQLPRGAKEKKKKTASSKTKASKTSSSSMTDAEVIAENRTMEAMKRRIQAQYAAIKESRRRSGEKFHL